MLLFVGQISADGNITYSSLTFVPGPDDGGQYLTCRAENHELPASVMEDTFKLDVQCNYAHVAFEFDYKRSLAVSF